MGYRNISMGLSRSTLMARCCEWNVIVNRPFHLIADERHSAQAVGELANT